MIIYEKLGKLPLKFNILFTANLLASGSASASMQSKIFSGCAKYALSRMFFNATALILALESFFIHIIMSYKFLLPSVILFFSFYFEPRVKVDLDAKFSYCLEVFRRLLLGDVTSNNPAAKS